MDVQLSIIIPHKDSPDTLHQLLETIPDHPKYEVIVVDDLSETAPPSNLAHRQNLRLFITLKGRRGPGAARNIGLSEARGRWVIFADADDWFTENAFGIIDGYLKEDVEIVYFKPQSKHHTESGIGTRHQDYAALVHEYVHYNSDWIRYRFHSPWSKLIRRSLFTRTGVDFDETPVANDIVCSLRLGIAAERIMACEETIYVVRQGRPNSLSQKRDENFFNVRLGRHFRYNEVLRQSGLRDRSMGALSTLRKSIRLGYSKFFHVCRLIIKKEQPILDRPSYTIILIRRMLRRFFSSDKR